MRETRQTLFKQSSGSPSQFTHVFPICGLTRIVSEDIQLHSCLTGRPWREH